MKTEMTIDELRRIVQGGESETVEFKETTGQRGEAAKTLCAFLNGNGGTVVFGVSRNGKLVGQIVSDETKKDLARVFCDFEPGVEIPVEYVAIDDTHQAIVCRVGSGKQKPYAYDGRPYRRVQSTTTKMPQEQYNAMLAVRGGFQSKWELECDDNVSLADVDLDEVTRTARIAVAEGRLSPDVDVSDAKDLLRRFGLIKDGKPLNGAMALFGKDLTFYPHCILKLAWFKGKDKTFFLDNRLVSGNIIQLQSEAMAFCFKHLNLSGVVRGLYREEELEIPAEALREAIINALAHRLYTNNGGVSLAIYEDRVEISNPGNFNPDSTLHDAIPGMASSPRNPSIAKVLYLRKAIEMWGRGISLIVDACKKAHLPPPKIYEDRGFIYTVFTRPTAQEWEDKVGEGQSTTVTPVSTTVTPVSTTDKMESTTNDMSAATDDDRVEHLLAAFKELRGDAQKNIEFALRELLIDSSMTAEAIAKKVGVSSRTIQRAIISLANAGIIKRIGPDKGGHWEVVG